MSDHPPLHEFHKLHLFDTACIFYSTSVVVNVRNCFWEALLFNIALWGGSQLIHKSRRPQVNLLGFRSGLGLGQGLL